jgi:selenocysteine lyase/cysteine desulfurase
MQSVARPLSDEDIAVERREYPGLDGRIFVDHAAVAQISRGVQRAMAEQTERHVRDALLASRQSAAVYDVGRERAAVLVGARADRVAYVQNTSYGISLVALGLDWRAGDNVVVPALEFPSNLLAWKALARRGIAVRQLDSHDGRVTADAVRGAIDDRTRIVAVSHVQFYSGYRVDLAALAAVCRAHDALLVVDGTQSVGALTVDMRGDSVDVVVVSAHKWMLGPLGIGFMALSDRAFERIMPPVVGWLSVNEPFAFRRELDLLPDARRFEPGTENAAGIYGLAERLRQIDALGIDRIEATVLALTRRVVERAEAAGLDVRNPTGSGELSGISLLRRHGVAPEALYAAIEAAGITASLRNGAVRISPHYYNTPDEIDQIIDVLRSA